MTHWIYKITHSHYLFLYILILSVILISIFLLLFLQDKNLPNELASITGDNEFDTKLDLARAFIETNQLSSAKEILVEVIKHGTTNHKLQAQSMLQKL